MIRARPLLIGVLALLPSLLACSSAPPASAAREASPSPTTVAADQEIALVQLAGLT